MGWSNKCDGGAFDEDQGLGVDGKEGDSTFRKIVERARGQLNFSMLVSILFILNLWLVVLPNPTVEHIPELPCVRALHTIAAKEYRSPWSPSPYRL